MEGASKAFHFDFRNKVVLDIGSSTGGFTQYALDHGATKVIAIEKGTNQMASPLRFDSRIELHERTDIFDVQIQTVLSEGIRSAAARGRAREPRGDGRERRGPKKAAVCICAPDVVLADVSFISLKPILKYVSALKHAEFLVMLKPQFEAKPYQLNKGIIKNEKIRREIIKDFETWLKTNGFLIVKKRDNDLAGKNGNLERFYWLKLAK